jgi:hypothetical protein
MKPITLNQKLALFTGLTMVVGLLAIDQMRALAQNASDTKRVKIVGSGVELLDITLSASNCPNQKGETIRLKVISDTAIDVRWYTQTGYKQWVNKDFLNQNHGDEITNYRCDQKRNYKIYSRAAGSAEAWPKP